MATVSQSGGYRVLLLGVQQRWSPGYVGRPWPVRRPSTITTDQAGFPFRQLAADEGGVFPDHFDHDWRAGSRERVYHAVRNLQPGVTEVHVQPAIDTPEVRALTPQADAWIDDLRLVTVDHGLRELIRDSGAVLVGYRALRDAMRAG